jgi:hypothetical protein
MDWLADILATGRDELTTAESLRLIEDECQRSLGVSLAEFRAAAEADELPRRASVGHIAALAGIKLKGCWCGHAWSTMTLEA